MYTHMHTKQGVAVHTQSGLKISNPSSALLASFPLSSSLNKNPYHYQECSSLWLIQIFDLPVEKARR